MSIDELMQWAKAVYPNAKYKPVRMNLYRSSGGVSMLDMPTLESKSSERDADGRYRFRYIGVLTTGFGTVSSRVAGMYTTQSTTEQSSLVEFDYVLLSNNSGCVFFGIEVDNHQGKY